MKRYFSCIILFALGSVSQNAYAQANALRLSANPEAGKKIMITYDPSGTPLDQMKGISIFIFYWTDNAVKPILPVARTIAKKLTASFIVPSSARL
jgi:hypothetical protein